MIEQNQPYQPSSEPQRKLMAGLSILIVSLMMASMAATAVQVAEILVPGWSGAYLVMMAFLVSIESMVSLREAPRLAFPELQWFLYHMAEWIVILTLVKLASYIEPGPAVFVEDLLTWSQSPGSFFTQETIFIIILTGLVWVLSRLFAADLLALDLDEKTLRAEQESGIYEHRSRIRSELVNRVLMVGSGMVLLSSALRIEAFTSWLELPLLRAGVVNLLLYFLLALVLLSLTQYAALRVQWMLEGLSVRKELAVRWFIYSFLFISLVALLSAVLPTHYTLSLLAIIQIILMVLSGVVGLIFTLLSLPFFFLLSILSLLRGGETPVAPAPDIFKAQVTPSLAAATSIPWLEYLKSVLFWAIFLAVIGFSLYFYLREHQAWLKTIARLPFIEVLGRFFKGLLSWVNALNNKLVEAVESGAVRLRRRWSPARNVQPWGYLNLRKLNDRQRIFFYYLAMVRRAGEIGWPRQPSQTPSEYSEHLLHALVAMPADQPPGRELGASEKSDVVDDVAEMTGKFIEARYSLHQITPRDVSLVRRAWQQLRRSFKRLNRMGNRQEDEDG